MNKTDYLIEDDYTPQSRYDNLKEVEPEFWKHKKLEQMNNCLLYTSDAADEL